MSFTKNFNIIISSLAVLFISISCMLGIFIASSFEKETLIFSLANSITLEVEQDTEILYDINFADAEVTFLVADPSIAAVDNNQISGKAEGTTILRATAIYNGQIKYASCVITVTAKAVLSYNFTVESIENCTYQNNTIYLEDDTACFKLLAYNNNNQNIDVGDLVFSCSKNLHLSKQLDFLVLTANCDGYIEFNIKDIKSNFTIIIKKN